MKKMKKYNSALKALVLICSILVMQLSITSVAFAASDKITSIRVTINQTKQSAGEVWTAEPTVSSKDYYISDYSWSKDYDDWTPGSKVTLTVTLESDEKSFDKDATVSVSNGEVASKTRNSTHKFTVKMNYIPRVTLAAPTDIYYEDEYTLVWDSVEYAGGYEIRLHKDGSSSSYKTIKLEGRKNTSADLSSYATDDYDITVSIRAVAASGKTSYITASDWVYFDDDYITSSENSTVYGSFSGSGSNVKFKDSDTDEYATGWQMVNGSWYYFDPGNGNRAVTSQWYCESGCWYYFDSDGRMVTGWLKDGDFWYYLNAGTAGVPYGAMVTGWVRTGPNSPWYYMNNTDSIWWPYGAMLTDTITPDGYYVNPDGEWNG